MSLFDDLGLGDVLDLRDVLGDDKRCARCKERDGTEVALEATTVFDPSQQVRVSAWECPECGHRVYRDTGNGVELYDPPQ